MASILKLSAQKGEKLFSVHYYEALKTKSIGYSSSSMPILQR
jgi:hypothetical protein